MKKIISFFIAITFNLTSFAQLSLNTKAPDYDAIEKNIDDEESNLYYPKLMVRYLLGDTTMSIEEKRHLYYGYVFMYDYAPNTGSEKYNDSLKAIIYKDSYTEKDLELMITYGEYILEENPFSLNTLENLISISKKQGDIEAYKLYSIRLYVIIEAFASSGDGFSEESAFYVIDPYHEFYFTKMMGFEFNGNYKPVGKCDYLEVNENDIGIKGLYYNISPCIDYLNKHSKK